jgi:ATP:cob(I)alamin adenosyltransferase
MNSNTSTDIPRSKIYTKKGDKGMTSLYNGRREKKNNCLFMGCGEVDELNSAIGLAIGFCECDIIPTEMIQILYDIQVYLFDIGAVIATPIRTSSKKQLARVQFDNTIVNTLEKHIDLYDSKLEPLKNFILPSGGLAGAQLHVCRTICRKAERSLIALLDAGDIPACIVQFMNRLSDLLFILARYASNVSGNTERIYRKTYM